MDARDPGKRLKQFALAALSFLVVVGLWQCYGRWALDRIDPHAF